MRTSGCRRSTSPHPFLYLHPYPAPSPPRGRYARQPARQPAARPTPSSTSTPTPGPVPPPLSQAEYLRLKSVQRYTETYAIMQRVHNAGCLAYLPAGGGWRAASHP